MYPVLEGYVRTVRNSTILAPEQEREMIDRIMSGDNKAREEFIHSNIGLVLDLARKYAYNGNLEEIVQEGIIGLINAVDRFNPSKGVKFSTFAYPSIEGSILKYFRSKVGAIKIPSWLTELKVKIDRITEDYIKEYGEEPSPEEISQRLNSNGSRYTVEHIERALQTFDMRVRSLDQLQEDGDLNDFSCQCPEEKATESLSQRELNEIFDRCLRELKPRESQIIRYRFYEGMGPKEIKRRLGISEHQFRWGLERGLEKLRSIISENASFSRTVGLYIEDYCKN